MDQASNFPRILAYTLLEEITNGFSVDRELGRGTYGIVYQGLHVDGEKIAVKLLRPMLGLDNGQFEKEYHNLERLQHQNIVRLVGYCNETRREFVSFEGRRVLSEVTHRALCFEYMENGSLDNILSDESSGHEWHTRYSIMKGICKGLKYLHEELVPPIFHLDLKPANVLLDKNWLPKIADFGLSRLIGEKRTYITTSSIGTIGYLPPEFITRQKISNKLDVFSLGVIMLKIMAGPMGYSQIDDMSPEEFVKLVSGNWRRRLHAASLDALETYCKQVETCTEIALRCVEIDRHKRPTIGDIINELNVTESMSQFNVLQYSGSQAMPRQTDRYTRMLIIRLASWLSVATVLVAIIGLVLRFDLRPDVKAVSRHTLICLHIIYMWLIRLAVWLFVVVVAAISVLMICGFIVRVLKDICFRTLITRVSHIRMAIWLSVGLVLGAIAVLVLHFNNVPEVKAISIHALIICMRVIWCAFWLGIAMLLVPIVGLVLADWPNDGYQYIELFGTFATWVTIAVILAAINVPMLRLVVVPELKADIQDARINSFALFTSGIDSFFEYNISVAISVHNPVMAMSVTYTEPLAGTVFFNGQRLYNDTFISIGKKHPAGKVRIYLLYSSGQLPSHILGAHAVDEYKKQNTEGVFSMKVLISGEITLGLGDRHKLSLSCPLSLRLVPVVAELHKVYCVPVETGQKYS